MKKCTKPGCSGTLVAAPSESDIDRKIYYCSVCKRPSSQPTRFVNIKKGLGAVIPIGSAIYLVDHLADGVEAVVSYVAENIDEVL